MTEINDIQDECFYCGQKGTLQSFGCLGTGEPPFSYDYHCSICGYSWTHWSKSKKNERTYPRTDPFRTQGVK